MIQDLETPWRYSLAGLGGLICGGYIGTMLATVLIMFVREGSVHAMDPLEPFFLRYSWASLQADQDLLQTAYLIVGVTVAGFMALGISGVYRGSLTQYDNAHYQSKKEIRKNKMLDGFAVNGFVFGKLGSPKSGKPFVSAAPNRFPHVVIVAPTGRGKGVGFVLPNLFHFEGSAIVLDVKGENFEITAIHRQKGMRSKIWYFSPFDYVDYPKRDVNSEPRRVTRTHRFNPLARIAAMASADEQYTALNILADMFLVVEGESARNFYQAGKRLFVTACLYAIEQGKPNLGFASEIMDGGGNRVENYQSYAERTKIPIVSRTFLEMAGATQKIVDSYISVINGAGFELWSDPSVVRATSESDFDFSTFRSQKQSLYIAVQSEHLKTLSPLIRLLFADAIASLQRSKPCPDEPYTVMFLMDEFDQLGRQPLVLQSIKTIRSFGGRFFIITQSIAGLDSPSLYGEPDRRSLLASAGVQIYMTPQDDRTAQVLSEALGKETIVSKSENQSRVRDLDDSANVSRSSVERPLVSPSKLLQFPLDKVLILAEGQYPIKADHIRYYIDRHFAPINEARRSHKLPYPSLENAREHAPVAKLSGLSKKKAKAKTESQKLEELGNISAKMQEISSAAKAKRKPPVRREP